MTTERPKKKSVNKKTLTIWQKLLGKNEERLFKMFF